MRVRCITNTGKGFSKYTLEHRGCSVESSIPFDVGKEYVVYGQLVWRRMLQYLLLGSGVTLPSWYPAEAFEVVDSHLPHDWVFQYNPVSDLSAIWGFKELVYTEGFNDQLMDYEENAAKIFINQKIKMDQEDKEWQERQGASSSAF